MRDADVGAQYPGPRGFHHFCERGEESACQVEILASTVPTDLPINRNRLIECGCRRSKGRTSREEQGKRLLMIFKGDGDWCPWCNRLEALLQESSALDDYLSSEGILGAKIGIPPKIEDTEGIRERFGITGIPFITFYADDGRLERHDGVYRRWRRSIVRKLDRKRGF